MLMFAPNGRTHNMACVATRNNMKSIHCTDFQPIGQTFEGTFHDEMKNTVRNGYQKTKEMGRNVGELHQYACPLCFMCPPIGG